MGGTSTSNTTQSSSTSPWATGQNVVNGIVGQLNPLVQNSGLNSTEQGAINQLTANAQNGNPYAPQIGGLASNLLSGGGATSQAPQLQHGLSTLQSQLTPYANGSMIGNNPALQAQLDQIASDTTNQVNGQFAAAGRLGSGMNQQTLARGIAQGEAPVIANQYNQDVGNQLNAANTLYGAQNTTSGALTGLNQQGLTNQLQGVQAGNDALTANNYGAQSTLAAQLLGQQIPAQNLGLLAQIGIPIAGLGTNSTGTSNTSNTASPLTQFQQLMSGMGGLSTSASGAMTGTGALGLLALL